mgnify:CR=1 FL=1
MKHTNQERYGVSGTTKKNLAYKKCFMWCLKHKILGKMFEIIVFFYCCTSYTLVSVIKDYSVVFSIISISNVNLCGKRYFSGSWQFWKVRF